MAKITTYMDYAVSSKPIRVVDRKADKTRLNIASLSIVNVGHLPGRTLFRSNATFPHFAIVFISDGAGTFRINDGEPQEVRKGSLFFLRTDAVYNYGPLPGDTWDEHYFTVEGNRINEWLGSWVTETDKVKHVGNEDIYHHKMDTIFMLMESGAPGDQDRAALMLESLLLEFILMEKSRQTADRAYSAPKLMEDIVHSIYETFHPMDICERNHISLSTLRRLVQKHTGYPLNEYVHRLKISAAKNTLLNTDKSVKEIADLYGYSDAYYFSRIFKMYAGVSPRDYRNQV